MIEAVGDGVTDLWIWQTDQRDDVAGFGTLGLHAAQLVEEVDLSDFAVEHFAVGFHHGDLLTGRHAAADDAADRDAADVLGPFQRRDHHLQRAVGIDDRTRHELDYLVEQRLHVVGANFRIVGRVAFTAGRKHEREVERVVTRTEFDEQIEDFAEHFLRTSFCSINFVDDDNRLEPVFERLHRDESRLRLRAFEGIDEDQHAVGHAEHSFDFATKVGVAGRVHDVDLHALVIQRDILRENRDAALTFEIVRVEHAGLSQFRIAKLAALLEQRIDERRLAVIDVRDDRDVANVAASCRSGGSLRLRNVAGLRHVCVAVRSGGVGEWRHGERAIQGR